MNAATAAAKTVLVVEDEETVRRPLVDALKNRGFNAEGAADVPETRRLIDKLGETIDVAVLDMSLEDRRHPDLTGAHLGREVRLAHPDFPPEFLVVSGHQQANFYDAALQLGVASYLIKGTLSQDDIVRHIRSLALRHALNAERNAIGDKIEAIAERYKSSAGAVVNLCRQVLEPEMRACLGVLPMFLLSDDKGTQNCTKDVGLPIGYSPAYEKIQALTFGAVNNDGPFMFRNENSGASLDSSDAEVYRKLDGSGFLPLHSAGDFRLSVGILPAEIRPNAIPEEPDKLATILWTYVRQPIGELLNLLSRMEAAIEKAKRETLLKHTSRFCLYVGQTQLDVLNEAVEKKEIEPSNNYFQKLKKLAQDLQATGSEFSRLSSNNQMAASAEKGSPVSVSSVIQRAWGEIEDQFFVENLTLREKGEDFTLEIEENDLFIAALRVLQWMAQREDKIPTEVATPAVIDIEYSKGDRLEIRFTDQSRRLGDQLRKRLFEPFTQVAPTKILTTESEGEQPGLYLPLYLAKVIVEVKNDGSLEDITDEMDGAYGHRFLMSFSMED